MARFCRVCVVVLMLLMSEICVCEAATEAGPIGSLTGRVRALGDVAAPDAEVQIVDLHMHITVERDGAFHANGLPAGEHRVMAMSSRYGAATETVNVEAGKTVDLTVRLSPLYRDEVVVSAGAEERTRSESYQATAVLSGEELRLRQQPSLGATIANEPGVSSTYFGAAVGRPILRGLGGDRVRILSNGTDVGDLSAIAPDHAVDAEVLLADRVEILRGAATLLYGSSAVGGVVNVIDDRIPTSLIEKDLTGSIDIGGGSVANEHRGALLLDGRIGRMAWHIGMLRRKNGDYAIPGFAGLADVRRAGDRSGTLLDSMSQSANETLGLSFIGDSGFVGLAATRMSGTYGLPGALEGESTDNGPKTTRHQDRVEARGETHTPLGFLDSVRFNFGLNRYGHVEAEESSLFGTVNTQESWEGRVEARQRPIGPLTGSFGVQVRRRSIAIIGEEAFVPPAVTKNRAVFALEELTAGSTRWQAGLRYETQDAGGAPDVAPQRDHKGLSSSIGVVWTPAPTYAVAFSVTHALKFPEAEELFSYGAHIATQSFETGNANLGKETNSGFDLSLRKTAGRLSGEVNLFDNQFHDFIYQQLTTATIEDLPVLRYTQGDSVLRGGEFRVAYSLLQSDAYHLAVEGGADVVHARLRSGENLPRIPPFRYGGGLRYERGRFWSDLSIWHTSGAVRLAPLETPTRGYTAVDVGASVRLITRDALHDIIVRCSNLTNAEMRSHTSFLKDLAPQPGRNFDVAYKITF
jgi:Outer membrane receptor proteins, mostly Fe transport